MTKKRKIKKLKVYFFTDYLLILKYLFQILVVYARVPLLFHNYQGKGKIIV